MTEYEQFLESKRLSSPIAGFDIADDQLNANLFPFQRDIVRWALKRGRAALFCDCGMGKTLMQLVWSQVICERTGGNVLIIAPLVVSAQTVREGQKFGIPVNPCRSQSGVKPGINITNYEMIGHFDAAAFVGVVLDESSILKNFMGKIKRELLEMFERTIYKLACTATPAPNDHLELGNHAEFLGVMPSNEMIMRWFINDTMEAGGYRLKHHAEKDYWKWVSSWAVCVAKPSDLGYPDEGFSLPKLSIETHFVDVPLPEDADTLIFDASLSATTMHREMRRTCQERAAMVAELIKMRGGCWIVWCNTNYEADALIEFLPDASEVRGSETNEGKERKLIAFCEGKYSVLITKPSIAGMGLNFQHCSQMAFVGLSYSFEQFYQAVRRSWRFGQEHEVEAHVIVAETEGNVLRAIQRKQADFEEMKRSMYQAMQGVQLGATTERKLLTATSGRVEHGAGWTMYNGDACKITQQFEDDTVGFSVYSPPFANLYIYSDHEADMGNSASDEEFFQHYQFLLRELNRVTMPGRLTAVHCKDLPLYRGRDGAAGLSDFPGRIIRAHEDAGWTFHSRVTIWKDPVIEMQRTKNHGLLYKNLRANSCVSRQGMADYLIVFRKWTDDVTLSTNPVPHDREDFPLDQWQKWASPVWMDINQTRVLNYQLAREGGDEKHICPLQLDVIERALVLWSNAGDLVFSPFAGIGSEGHESLRLGRQFVGAELKEAYFNHAVRNLENAVTQAGQQSMFDEMELAS